MGARGEGGAWVGEGVRREVFYFRSSGVDLYASLYAAEPLTRDLGVVLCNAWGFEGDRADALMHGLAVDAMAAGGAGLVFHYPGFGDSGGTLTEATLETLATAAVDALAAAADRCPDRRWTLAGFRLGAAVACLAAPRCAAERLLLVQPALDGRRYVERLERSARRAAARRDLGDGAATGGLAAYGYPLPSAAATAAFGDEAAVQAALADFAGAGAVVWNEEPPPVGELPERFERIVVPGAWTFAGRDTVGLRRAAAEWLTEPE